MYLLKAALGVLWFVCLPFCVGLHLTGRMRKYRESVLMTILSGYTAMFGLFEVMALPMIYAKISFSVLAYSYGACILILSLLAVIFERKRIIPMFRQLFRNRKGITWTMAVALLLIFLQVAVYIVGMSTDLDDAFYVGTATTTLETNTMFQYNSYTGLLLKQMPSRYVLSPFPVLLAFYGKVIGMNPTIIAHSIMPVFFVALAYSVYGLLGMRLFQEDRKATGMFLCFLSLIHMFSYYSVYTQGTFMLIRIWQGKAFLASVLLPFLFFFGYHIFTEECKKGEWITLFCLTASCCLVSSMGIMLAPIMLGILAFLYGLLKKQWKKLALSMVCCLPCVLLAAAYVIIR